MVIHKKWVIHKLYDTIVVIVSGAILIKLKFIKEVFPDGLNNLISTVGIRDMGCRLWVQSFTYAAAELYFVAITSHYRHGFSNHWHIEWLLNSLVDLVNNKGKI